MDEGGINGGAQGIFRGKITLYDSVIGTYDIIVLVNLVTSNSL